MFIYNEIPSGCHGSYEKVNNYRALMIDVNKEMDKDKKC